MIRYETRPYERAFTFQILSQDKAVEDAIDNLGGSFISSNGWKISSENSPELKVRSKEIFLRGKIKDADWRIDRTWNLPSNADRDLVINNIHQAMRELISSATAMKYPSSVILYDPTSMVRPGP